MTAKMTRRAPILDEESFTLSNLSFEFQTEQVTVAARESLGIFHRQAAGAAPSPVVGWLWQGGKADTKVWHSGVSVPDEREARELRVYE